MAEEEIEFASVVGEMGEGGGEAPDGVGFGTRRYGTVEGVAFEGQEAALVPDAGDDLLDATPFGWSIRAKFVGEGGEESVEVLAGFRGENGGGGAESVAEGVHGGASLALFGLASFGEFCVCPGGEGSFGQARHGSISARRSQHLPP
jgi:hypothetical protein